MSEPLGLNNGLFQAFLDYLYSAGNISIPTDFHSRCAEIEKMLDNDITGIINTITDYSINSASESIYSIESSNETLEKLLNTWLDSINIRVNGIPTGLKELSKEYYKERWNGSSLCLMRVSNWKTISVSGAEISVPTVLWFVNGASVHVKRDDKNYTLGSDKYYLDIDFKKKLPAKLDEKIVIQKPFDRWFDKYSTPYLIRKGVLKNYLGIKAIQEKSDEVITKILPYLFVISKGTENLYTQAKIDYTEQDLKDLVSNFKTALETYHSERGNVPTNAVPFDQKYEHLIPDLTKILSEELYRQGYRALLSGLGFVDVIQGVSSTRRESVLNPKPFIAEVNAGVDGFKNMLMDVVNIIIEENKEKHRKLFSENNELKIVSSPLRINVDEILDSLRSGFVYGVISIKTYQEMLGVDPDKELTRMRKEMEEGLRDLFYPHLIQNQEATPDMNVRSIPTTKKEIEKNLEKEKATEEDIESAPYDNLDELPKAVKKYSKHAQEIWRNAFNEALKQNKGEEYAFRVAWSALQKYVKKQKQEQKQ